ncbi:hypothetical protein CC86DRAFT_415021 [Ophiobolus disseminans]|uniref:Uncharacterized protein n=1 Tax=Ophiobolus disseminans TaxID=1469910 RepID=A0A6A7AJ77_9PLEO|nr:hypothetical protein CC86DRAFT_415021 [Ophiobolus disseminans]
MQLDSSNLEQTPAHSDNGSAFLTEITAVLRTKTQHTWRVCQLPKHSSLPYVALDPEVMRYLCWSNNPNELWLDVYFNPLEPNLSQAYNVAGLRPVVREKDGDAFILQDEKKRFYLWKPWDGDLLRVKDVWTKGFDSNEKIVEHLIIYMSGVERGAEIIYRDIEID